MVLYYLFCLSLEHALAFYNWNIQKQKFNVSDNLDDSFVLVTNWRISVFAFQTSLSTLEFCLYGLLFVAVTVVA